MVAGGVGAASGWTLVWLRPASVLVAQVSVAKSYFAWWSDA